MCKSSFTVYFEEPFWVGLYERVEDGRLRTCRVVFGPEPKDYEVYRFLLDNWQRLAFGPAVEASERPAPCKNPKRRQRAIARQLQQGVGTKAQQAVSLARQAEKCERKKRSRAQRQAEAERQWLLRAEKKKQKHRGR